MNSEKKAAPSVGTPTQKTPQPPVSNKEEATTGGMIKQQSQSLSVVFAILKMAVVVLFCGMVAVIASAINSRVVDNIFEIFN